MLYISGVQHVNVVQCYCNHAPCCIFQVFNMSISYSAIAIMDHVVYFRCWTCLSRTVLLQPWTMLYISGVQHVHLIQCYCNHGPCCIFQVFNMYILYSAIATMGHVVYFRCSTCTSHTVLLQPWTMLYISGVQHVYLVQRYCNHGPCCIFQVFNMSISYSAILTVILAFSVAFASRLILDEVTKPA